MSLLSYFFGTKQKTASMAKERLSLIIAHERGGNRAPDFLPALSNLARLDIGEKQIDVARKRYDDFLAKNPKNSQAYLQYAELLAMTGTPVKDVQAVLDRGLAATPARSQGGRLRTRLATLAAGVLLACGVAGCAGGPGASGAPVLRGTGDLGVVIERATGSVQVVDNDARTSLARIEDLDG